MHGLGFDHSCLCPMAPMIPMTPRIHPDTRASRHPLHPWTSVLSRCFLVSHMPFLTWRYILSVPRYLSQRRQTLGLQPRVWSRLHHDASPNDARMEPPMLCLEPLQWSDFIRSLGAVPGAFGRVAEQGVCCIVLSQCCLEKTQARRSSNTEYTLS
jgi:hypothetical protein